ncbi:uncharacterized protein LOC125091433 [Lutra lutra]|uniref:uncharacterized protein LOC125091433 n=1 Tax=Lutra lutra TaxID=9657 RepID=UPI001FCFD208|nr:uncharacterized protein LOC125091433 [Lutra lutra]
MAHQTLFLLKSPSTDHWKLRLRHFITYLPPQRTQRQQRDCSPPSLLLPSFSGRGLLHPWAGTRYFPLPLLYTLEFYSGTEAPAVLERWGVLKVAVGSGGFFFLFFFLFFSFFFFFFFGGASGLFGVFALRRLGGEWNAQAPSVGHEPALSSCWEGAASSGRELALQRLSPSVLLPITDQSWPTASRVQRLRRRLRTRRPQGRAAEWGKQGAVPAPDLLIRLAALPPRTEVGLVSSFFNGVGGRAEGRKEVVRDVRQSPGPWEIGNRARSGLVPRALAPRAQPEVGSPVRHHPSLSPLTRPSEGPSVLVPRPSLPRGPYSLPPKQLYSRNSGT